jgi:hypothetical protein
MRVVLHTFWILAIVATAATLTAASRRPLVQACTNSAAYVQSAVGGVSSSMVVETVTPTITANDGAGNPISGATPGCPTQDQFANPIAMTLNEPASAGTTEFEISTCGGSYSSLETTGTILEPLDNLKVVYDGGGVAGNGTSSAPYVAAVIGTPGTFPVPTATAPYTGIVTYPGAIEYIVAPLFAYVVAPGGGTSSSAGSGTATVNLSGPGTGTATLYATQYLPPSQNFTAYTATKNAACTSGGQTAVGVSSATTQTYGASFTLTPGALSSSSCTVTLSDGTSNVVVTVTNSAGNGGGTILIP